MSMHVRRGDLAYANEVLRRPRLVYGPVVSASYLHAAMRCFPDDATFVVLSDDAAWCRERLRGPRVHVFEGGDELDDLMTMKACDHHVVSNSSFSWWGAWLNARPGRRVVAPDPWFWRDRRAFAEQLVPSDWIRLEAR